MTMENIRVYCLDWEVEPANGESVEKLLELPDERFMEISEEQGWVWSLQGFQEAFNNGDISDQWLIRFIKIEQ